MVFTALSQQKNIDAIVISMDLPFSIAKFCTAADIENLNVAGDFRHVALEAVIASASKGASYYGFRQ